ncbi:hypothetical protein D3C71_1547910 [compost metagenome]
MSLEKNLRLAVVQETTALAFDFVDGHDRGELNAQACCSAHQQRVLQQVRTIDAGQRQSGFRARNTVNYQPNLTLVITHRGFGGVTEIAVRIQTGAVQVEALLQCANLLPAIAVAQNTHS